MGAGASSGLIASLDSATPDELSTVLAGVSEGERSRLFEALSSSEDISNGNSSCNKRFEELWPAYEEKMYDQGCSQGGIDAFKNNFKVLCSGVSTMISESMLNPVKSIPELEKLEIEPDPNLLKSTVILKLNGGLGTGMGLNKAKSLLPVVNGKSFLDLIAQQIICTRKKYERPELKFLLMNSFSTSLDTLEALSKYSVGDGYDGLGYGADLQFLQNQHPKVTKSDYTPVSWDTAKELEWCPPGHGDLYAAMVGSGTLDSLLSVGMKYMFVSNSDNLGATMDLKILTHFVNSGAPFMMEVALRTDADKKGGHLGSLKEGGGLTLRESAQCAKEDEQAFQDTSTYCYFNTNNLWLDLNKLKEAIEKAGGALPLPVMFNDKTVDPRDKQSTKVIQLETAMGAGISCFEGATALLIPRTRFAPVKKCDDLLSLRSDAYVLTEDFRIELAQDRNGVPPLVKLDDRYKFVDAMETLIPHGVPSLKECTKLIVQGEVEFAAGVVIKGSVTFKNGGDGKKVIEGGTYENQTVEL